MDNIRCNQKIEFFKAKPDDIKEYFLMENLVETFADIHDFPSDYFTQYVGVNTLKIYRKDEIKIIDFEVDVKVGNVVKNVIKDVTKVDEIDVVKVNEIDNKDIDNLKCNLCSKHFRCEYLFNKHKNAKIKCNLNEIEIKIKKLELKIKMIEIESLKTKNTCKFCNLEYINLYSLQKHLKESCKKYIIKFVLCAYFKVNFIDFFEVNLKNIKIKKRCFWKKLSKYFSEK